MSADVEAKWSRGTLTATSTRRFGRREVRVRIRHHAWSDGAPDVTFSSRCPDAKLDFFTRWSTHYQGRLSGPMSLRVWRMFFEAFEAAFDAYAHPVETTDYYNRAWPDIKCPMCGSHRHPVAVVDMTPSGGVNERCAECGFTPGDGQTVPSNEATGGRVEVQE